MQTDSTRFGCRGVFCTLATLLLWPAVVAAAEPRVVELNGVRLELSAPVLVARSRGYLWFPTLARRPDGELLALMSNYADTHVAHATALTCVSRDGGGTWSDPRPAEYGDVNLLTPEGDTLLLPYYLRPLEEGSMGAAYQLWQGGEEVRRVEPGVRVGSWPRADKILAPDLGLAGFVFNGEAVERREGGYLATLYGTFDGESRYSLVAAASRDGLDWRVLSVIADENCPLEGAEGPCEAALAWLKDGRLMCVYRLASGVPLGVQFSEDDGETWSEPKALDGVFSVQPSLVVLRSGPALLSSGRPGIYLWINRDGTARDWQRVDLQAHHNESVADEPIDTHRTQTSSYTEVVAVGEDEALVIYDRVPHGWSAIPADSGDTNSVWVVRAKIASSDESETEAGVP